MKQAVNYFRGSVRVSIVCPYPERLVNVCAANDIEFWNLERQSATEVHVTVHIGGYRQLRILAGNAGFIIKEVKKKGVPFTLWKLRNRYVLLGGIVVMFLAVWTMSLFVWEIDVSGNNRIPSQQILEELDKLGVGIGSFGPSVSTEAISNDMIMRIPDLEWIAINVSGSHAEVLVRERTPKPQIFDEKAPRMVYALKPGIITKMSVLRGDYVARPGETVQPGDILVSGIMSSETAGKRIVHAKAEVWARTWYNLTMEMPLNMSQKSYTGEKKTHMAIVIAGNRINFYINGGIPFRNYDKITNARKVTLPTGNVLPLTFITEEYKEYDKTTAHASMLDASTLLQSRLMERLRACTEGGEIVSTSYDTDINGSVLTVTLHAECLEQIATERPFTAEELANALTPVKDKTKETGN